MTDDTLPIFEMIDGANERGLVLIADHARATIPDRYHRLGLPEAELTRHIAYDIGVEAVTRLLAARLGVPAIMATFSRLLIDPNRGMEDPTLIRQLYDGTIIDGNYPLDEVAREHRLATYYRPYHAAVAELIAAVGGAARAAPMLIAVHSFTPFFKGVRRPWHAGVLWDGDHRVAGPLIEMLREEPGLVIGDNEPYDGALPGDTMSTHGTRNGYPHALIEIRQDLIADQAGAAEWADRLAPMLDDINRRPDIHQAIHFASRTQAA